MNSSEVKRLLNGIKMVDNRRIHDGTIEMWRRILSDMELHECQMAVIEHFRTSSSYLEPQHIRQIVRRWREERIIQENKKELYKEGESVPAPENLDEMVKFYSELAKSHYWGPHEDPEEVARVAGLEPPKPIWKEEK
jgi:hypothetical protein